MFLKISQLNGPLQQKKSSKYKNTQLIHMTLQECLVIKDI
jgi:hypothetical protein